MTLQKGAGIRAAFRGTQSGTIIMDGEKFHLDCNEIKTWFDGKTQWSYVEENEEVNITEPTQDELMAINPYLLFQSYDKGYGYQYKGFNTQKGIKGYEIKLIPEESGRPNITLVISDQYIPMYMILEQDKNHSFEFSVSSYQINQKYDKETFRFNPQKYPHAEIIDLR
jgi:outer membrane lipoprotein-sorting protein